MAFLISLVIFFYVVWRWGPKWGFWKSLGVSVLINLVVDKFFGRW